jgi:PAS domain S-box-containing protein
MKKRSKDSDQRLLLRQRLIGLGEKSVRKSYYPQLKARTEELTDSEERYRSIFNTITDALFIVDQKGSILEVNRSASEIYGYSREEFLSAQAPQLITPESQPVFKQYLAEIKKHGRFKGETVDRRKDGTTFHTEVHGSRIVFMGEECFLAVIRDVSERAASAKAIEAKARELASINRLAQEVSASLSVEEVLSAALKQAAQVIQPDVGFLFLSEGDDLILKETYPHGTLLADRMPACHKRGECLCGLAVQEGRPIYSVHIESDPCCTWSECKSAGLKSLAALPLKSEDRVIGLLAMGSLDERNFAEQAAFIETLVNEISIGLQNAILYEKEQSHAVQLSLHLNALRQKEEELRKKESHLRTIFESTTDGIISLDENRIIRDCNWAYLRTFGYQKDELIGRTAEIVHPSHESFVEFGETAYPVVREVGYWRGEWELCKKDGSMLPVEIVVSSLINQEDVLEGYVSVVRDSSERKRAEEELRANEQRMQAILEASADPVVVYDHEGIATYINPGFSRVFGWQPEEILGERIPFVPDDQKKVTQKNIKALFKEGVPKTFETKRFKKDGRILDVLVSAAGIPDETGRVTGMVVNLTDLTHTKQLESQLSQARKMEAVGTLAGGIAHDFNNILAAITGYSELALYQTKEDEPTRADINQILKAAERAKELVQQILAFSRKAASQPKPLNLNKVVSEALMILERTIPKMVSVELNLSPDLHLINGDPNQIEQVLLNLASNASDAMPEGGSLIIKSENMWLDEEHAESHLGAQPGDYVVLTISDTGLGMDRETLEHVFEPFYTTKDIGKGTGLGLASVYGIVQSHGGYITCYSEPEVGTTFKIYLPSLLSDDETLEPHRDEPDFDLHGSEKVMLVDDERSLRDIGKNVLQIYGYQVVTASSGEEALDVFQNQGDGIDLIVMDLGMPGMGGHKALKHILSMDPQAKVIIASGYSADSLVTETIESGAAGYIAKPFRKKDLLKTIRQVLDG